MTRCWLILFSLAALLSPAVVDAQHHSHHQHQRSNGGERFVQPVAMVSDYGFSHYSGAGFAHRHGHYLGNPYVAAAYFNQPTQVAYYSNPIGYFPTIMPWTFDPIAPGAAPPSPAARLKSLELQARGDQKMREQKWSEARAAYANSITAVPGRAEAHFRLAVCFVAIQRFDLAIREFKRAVVLDPTSVKNAKTLKVLMGPESQIVRTSIVSKLGDWAREEIHNPDRQFLHGAILHLDGDPQAKEVLKTAVKLKAGGDTSYIALFLNPNVDPMNGQFAPLAGGVPVLNDRPAPLFLPQRIADLRFPKPLPQMPQPDGPVPMPDGP